MRLKVKLDDGAYMPERVYGADAGFDLRTPIDVTIHAGSGRAIPTGVHIEIPFGYVGFLKSKSGLNVKSGILSEGVIDSGYTGSVIAKLYNHGSKDAVFRKGDKITQIVILPIPKVEFELVKDWDDTERGENGFGSTGIR